jgi:hypothetical protein
MVDPEIATACPKPEPLSPVNVTILFWQELETDEDEELEEDTLLQL